MMTDPSIESKKAIVQKKFIEKHPDYFKEYYKRNKQKYLKRGKERYFKIKGINAVV
jgi:hypothetical protein